MNVGRLTLTSLLLFVCTGLSACTLDGDDADVLPDPALAELAGSLSLEWQIHKDGALASCEDVGATTIEVSLWGELETKQVRSCFGGFAEMGPIPPGPHSIEVSLLDQDGQPLVTADMGEVDVPRGATMPLGAIELSL